METEGNRLKEQGHHQPYPAVMHEPHQPSAQHSNPKGELVVHVSR